MPETGTTDMGAGTAWPGATNPSLPQMHQALDRLPGQAQPDFRCWISRAILVKPFFSATS